VTTLEPGDHVTASFLPTCGRCRYCSTGQQYLCNSAKDYFSRGQFTDGTPRHHLHGEDLQVMAKLGTFAAHSVVAEASLIKIDNDLPLSSAALVSCGVSTGWGSAVERAGTRPGDVVVVVGVGGLGTAAVQGARLAGAQAIVAIDPSEYRRTRALDFGATHIAASMADAQPIVRDLTWGQGADRVIMTPSLLLGELLQQGLDLTGKGGTLVATAMTPFRQKQADIDLGTLALYNKEIKGCMFGSLNPRESVPRLLTLYRKGLLNLDDMVTTYPLDRINEAFQDMRDGTNVRGVLTFDD
jgi:S-(hydroxymethyl)glutathione dehydrogenase/alcohol dehydrogenase